LPYGPSAASVCVWYWFFILLYAAWCRWYNIDCFPNTFVCYCKNFLWVRMYSLYYSTQLIFILISSLHSFRYIIRAYTFYVC
jgi:hypothetical protein